MPGRVVWNIAAPMVGLSAVLAGLGAFAAWNVQQQQRISSELVQREVNGMLAIDELHMAMREIRYQVNIFLRTKELVHLAAVANLHAEADQLLQRAKKSARTPREQELIAVVELGYQAFFDDFQTVLAALEAANPTPATVTADQPEAQVSDSQAADLTRLSDDVMTNAVLQPLRDCLAVNRQVVERTNEASQVTVQHLQIGFLLLGICGGAAGLLTGTAIARAVGRSIVQLNVSVRGVAGRLSDVTGPVTISRTGGLVGIEAGLRTLEREIADVVERLQQRETEVLRSEQLARVGQLAAGLAHELRNPLMPMKMLVQAALERADGSGLRGRSLQIINDEIVRLERSIQEFLDFARPPVPEKSLAQIEELLRGTIELVAARARQQEVDLRLSAPATPVAALVDAAQIRQLVLNLLLNALDASPGGGHIDVSLQVVPTGPESRIPGSPATADKPSHQVAFPTEHDALRMARPKRAVLEPSADPWIVVRVADFGPGISPDLLKTIFEPFMTTKETGTGLGLSICQRIAAAHGGDLSAANRPGGGAEFSLWLPQGA